MVYLFRFFYSFSVIRSPCPHSSTTRAKALEEHFHGGKKGQVSHGNHWEGSESSSEICLLKGVWIFRIKIYHCVECLNANYEY
jgi:hypothetical protein